MLIGTIVAPPAAPQFAATQPSPPQTPRLDAIDKRIIEMVRRHGPVQIWPLLNAIEEEAPHDRAAARQARLQLWHRVKHLRGLGLVFTVGRNAISPTPVDAETRRLTRRSRRSTVRKAASFCGVSAQSPSTASNPTEPQQLILREDDNAGRLASGPPQKPDETKSAASAEQISEAAKLLAQLPRRVQKKWSGWIGNRHCFRGQRVILPTSEVAYIFGVLRGKVVATFDNGRLLGGYFGGGGPLRWTVVPVDRVTVYKCPEAQLLGRQKAGRREKASEQKAAAARKNGKHPCKNGRKRGRPVSAKFTQRQRPKHINLWSASTGVNCMSWNDVHRLCSKHRENG